MGATITRLQTGMSRYEVAERSKNIMHQYQFIPTRKRGGQKARSNGGRPRAVDVSVVIKLEEAFLLGCSLNEALLYADISTTAYYAWLEMNKQFNTRIEQLKAHPTVIARNSVVREMRYDGELALKYLERKLPDEFSLKGVQVNIGMAFDGIVLDKPKQVANLPDNHTLQISTEVQKPSLPIPEDK